MPHDFRAAVPHFASTKVSAPDSPNIYGPKDADILHGHLETPAGKIYTVIVCPEGEKTPLLVLHGGPGMASYYCEPMVSFRTRPVFRTISDARFLGQARIAELGHPVIFYDQLGCGRSDKGPADYSKYSIEHYVKEVSDVRKGLGLDGAKPGIHLLGQSWGTMLAVSYLTRGEHPVGIKSIVLCAPCLSAKEWGEGIQRDLFPKLPADKQKIITDCEAKGDFGNPAYHDAVLEFYQRHVCAIPWPSCMKNSTAAGESSPVYGYMWGPSEFSYNGTLSKEELATPEIFSKIDSSIPTLWTGGEEDECRPSSLEKFHKTKNGPKDKLYVFQGASHCHHIESEMEFRDVVGGFIGEAEK